MAPPPFIRHWWTGICCFFKMYNLHHCFFVVLILVILTKKIEFNSKSSLKSIMPALSNQQPPSPTWLCVSAISLVKLVCSVSGITEKSESASSSLSFRYCV